MTPVVIALCTILLLIFLSAPIGVALGFGTLLGVTLSDSPIIFFSQRLYNNFDSFPLMAIPFFILAGDIMQHGSLANSLLRLCRVSVGHFKGGLAHISVVTALFYGALCGSAAATTAAVGGTMIPAMEKEGYPKGMSTAVNAAAGSLGVMIPPSIPLILYGAFASVSITDLFIAGIVPGFMVAFSFILVNSLLVNKHGWGKVHPKASRKERLDALGEAKWAIGVPVIVLGAIYGGITTPTEAGAIAVLYAFLVETFITRSMDKQLFTKILKSTLRTNGLIFLIVIMANALGVFLQFYNVEQVVIGSMRSLTADPDIFLLITLVLLLILGTFLDITASIIIFTPLLSPLAASYGIDGVHFGMFCLIALCIGFITPPVGTNLFVGCAISGIKIIPLSKAVLPYIFAMLIVTLIFAYVPWLSLCLVR